MAIAATPVKIGRVRSWIVNSGPVLGIFAAIFVSVALFCTAPAVPNGVCQLPIPLGDRSTCPHSVRSLGSVFPLKLST